MVAAHQELDFQPVVLHARDARKGECVAACSRTARQAGVRPGMPMSEASVMLDRWQAGASNRRSQAPTRAQPQKTSLETSVDVHLFAHDPEEDFQTLQELAVWCEQFSPIVGLEQQQLGAAGLLLDVTGLEHLFGGEENLAQQVVAAFRQQRYWCKVAIAPTIGAAWALTRSMPARQWQPWIVRRSELSVVLHDLDVAWLRISVESIRLLRRLGIQTVGQLAALPRASLLSRFGQDVLLRLDQAIGSASEAIVAHRAAPQFSTTWDLEHATTKRTKLEQILQHLTQHMAQLLAMHNQGAVRLQCEFMCQAAVPVTLEVGLYRPSCLADHLWDLLRLQLESCRLSASVIRVQLEAVVTAKLPVSQKWLLASDGPADTSHELAVLINRLSGRLGHNAVTTARLRSGVLPEDGFAAIPLTAGPGVGDRQVNARLKSAAGKRPPPAPFERPLCLLNPPTPMDVLGIAPHGPPLAFRFGGKKRQVQQAWGPERIEASWWKGPSVRRDYYRTACDDGSWFWLFRQLDNGSWFVHGVFD